MTGTETPLRVNRGTPPPPLSSARDALVRLVATAIDGRRPADPDAAMALHSSAAERVVTALEDHPLTADLLARVMPLPPIPADRATAEERHRHTADRRRILDVLANRIVYATLDAGLARPGSWDALMARHTATVLSDVLDTISADQGPPARPVTGTVHLNAHLDRWECTAHGTVAPAAPRAAVAPPPTCWSCEIARRALTPAPPVRPEPERPLLTLHYLAEPARARRRWLRRR